MCQETQWPADTETTTPEAFAEAFLGRAAVESLRATGPRRKLVSFAAADPDLMLWGGELVLRNGAPTGQVMSAAWGAMVVCALLIYAAFLRPRRRLFSRTG